MPSSPADSAAAPSASATARSSTLSPAGSPDPGSSGPGSPAPGSSRPGSAAGADVAAAAWERSACSATSTFARSRAICRLLHWITGVSRTAADRVGGNFFEGGNGIAQTLLSLAIHIDEYGADIWVADPRGRIGVPGEGGTAGAAARLIFGGIGADRGIIGLLGFPPDDPVLDVDLPGTGSGAVHAVRRAHHFVVSPPVPIEHVTIAATLPKDCAHVLGFIPFAEKFSELQQGITCRAVDANFVHCHVLRKSHFPLKYVPATPFCPTIL